MAKRPTTRRKTARKATPSRPTRKAASARVRKAKPRAKKPPAAAAQPESAPSRGATTAAREGRSVPENFHALYDRGFRSSRGLAAPSGAPATSASARRMSREVQGLEIHYDQTTQLPNMIVAKAPSAPLARAASRGAAQTPEGAVAEFIRSKAISGSFGRRCGDNRSRVGQRATRRGASAREPRRRPQRGAVVVQPRQPEDRQPLAARRGQGGLQLRHDRRRQRATTRSSPWPDSSSPARRSRSTSGAGVASRAAARSGDAAGGSDRPRRVRPHRHAVRPPRFQPRRPTARQRRRTGSTTTSRGPDDHASAVRAAGPREGRDVPARRRAVRARLLHGALDQGLPGLQLRRSTPSTTPDVLFRKNLTSHVDVQVPGPQHRRRRVPPARTGRRPARRTRPACPTASRPRPIAEKLDHDREPAARPTRGCRPTRRRPTATTASPTPTWRPPNGFGTGDVMRQGHRARARSTTPTTTPSRRAIRRTCRTASSGCSST